MKLLNISPPLAELVPRMWPKNFAEYYNVEEYNLSPDRPMSCAIYSTTKESIPALHKQGLYLIPYSCGKGHVGHICRNTFTGIKEHELDCENQRVNKSALTYEAETSHKLFLVMPDFKVELLSLGRTAKSGNPCCCIGVFNLILLSVWLHNVY